ncbi:HD domain-containing protein [Tropicimonas sp. IMCC34043]|uniref:HD domain-containing protein n=1 Tax=Tropicimonas sp. IMCC34043 TaxID=2248760 RepID=UPI0013002A3E|nr:HD domain-containing protein [Tropicimonas sp. IMCC34043]
MSEEILKLSRALVFAAEAHRNQRRKGAAQEPYIDHLIEVMNLVGEATGGADVDLMIAALLHDAIEDTGVGAAELEARFGARVARIVVENSDDMSLSKPERKQRRLASIAGKPVDSRMVKLADVISNLHSVVVSAPAGWGSERKIGYLESCRDLVAAGRGASAELEETFARTAETVEQAIREMDGMDIEGQRAAVRHLETVIGQPVHTLYLPNTGLRKLSAPDIERLAEMAAHYFPSVTVVEAHAMVEGKLRPVLLARIRSDDSDAIVALAQRLGLAFDQDYIGIEVEGRYVRVYTDDTA